MIVIRFHQKCFLSREYPCHSGAHVSIRKVLILIIQYLTKVSFVLSLNRYLHISTIVLSKIWLPIDLYYSFIVSGAWLLSSCASCNHIFDRMKFTSMDFINHLNTQRKMGCIVSGFLFLISLLNIFSNYAFSNSIHFLLSPFVKSLWIAYQSSISKLLLRHF